MRVLFPFRPTAVLDARLAASSLDVVRIAEDDAEGWARELPRAEVLWHVLAPVTAQVLAAAPRLRLVQKWGAGINTIDLETAAAQGVAVANMPGANSQAVAEMTLCLMLATLRRTIDLHDAVQAGFWSSEVRPEHHGELAGRTVGFVGFGAVPQRLAPALNALGTRVVYASRTTQDEAWERLPLDRLLAEADIVSLHVPLTDQTRGLLDGPALARMRPGAILINTARGELVDEAALADALAAGRLAAAGLDVFACEPPPADHLLFGAPGVVLSPHVAWLTPETLVRCLDRAVANVRRLAQDLPVLDRVA